MKQRFKKTEIRTQIILGQPPARTRPDLARMALALDWIKLSLPKRLQSTLDFGELVMMASHLAKKEKALHALTPQAL